MSEMRTWGCLCCSGEGYFGLVATPMRSGSFLVPRSRGHLLATAAVCALGQAGCEETLYALASGWPDQHPDREYPG